MNHEINDKALSSIKELYELGDGGQYEIIKRSMFVIENALKFGKTSKECVDRLMDIGTKPTELGIAVCVSLARADPNNLCELDKTLRLEYITKHSDLIANFEKIEEQSEPAGEIII
jgi:hypothetical protein